MTVLATLLTVAAFMVLGLASDRHQEPRFGKRLPAPHRRRWRFAAWTLVATALVCATVARGWVFGPVLWTGMLMAGATTSFLWLNLTTARRGMQR